MIITRLSGGLGNQLFQYAVGRHLAEINNAALKFDVSEYEEDGSGRHALEHFKIPQNFATDEEVEFLKRRKLDLRKPRLLRLLVNCFLPRPTHIYEHRCFRFHPEVLKLKGNVYLDGYWQSEQYFTAIAGIIRKEVCVSYPQKDKDLMLAEKIKRLNSVSLHIRRGDYISGAKTRQAHGLCDLGYYVRCINKLTEVVEDPHFFVFSDDSEWAQANLKVNFPMVFVVHNGAGKDYEDLRLMSQCKHHILANSSFSWWGAWLNPEKKKMVLAPARWFAKKQWNYQDVVPTEWIKI